MKGVVAAVVIAALQAATVRAGPLVTLGGAARSIVADPVREAFYVSLDTDEVVKIDVAAAAIVARIAVGGAPSAMAVEPGGSRLYVLTSATHDLAIIDLAALALSGSIDLSSMDTSTRGGLAFGRPGRLYVHSDDGLSVVDTAGAGTEVAFREVVVPTIGHANASSVAVHPNNDVLYLHDQGWSPSSLVSVDVRSDCPYFRGLTCFGCLQGPGTGIVLSADGSRIYLGTRPTGKVLSGPENFVHVQSLIAGEAGVVLASRSDRFFSLEGVGELYISDRSTSLAWHLQVLQRRPATFLVSALALSSSELHVGVVVEEASTLVPNLVEIVDVSAPSPNRGAVKLRLVDSVTGAPVLFPYVFSSPPPGGISSSRRKSSPTAGSAGSVRHPRESTAFGRRPRTTPQS